MTHIPESVIETAVATIIATRDFCGDERAAIYDLVQDLGFPFYDREKLYRIANFRANNEWNNWKKAAAVNPKYCF